MPLTFRLVSRRALLQQVAAASTVSLVACATKSEGDSGPVPDTPDTDGIAPITPNEDFYVTSCCGTPAVDPATWTLTIAANGSPLATTDLAGLEALPARDKEHTLECISGGPSNQAISNAIWTGLPLTEVLAALGVTVPATAVELKMTCADGYSTSIPVTDLDRPVWLVWRMNGEPLPDQHGKTARFLVPGRYGMKNPKWVVEIDFVDVPYVGYWEALGWSNDASYQANTLIRSPFDGQTLPAGTIELIGTAYAGSDAVGRVQVTIDDGATWADADLTYQRGADVWTLWRFVWEATPGIYRVQARCTTASGMQSGGEYGTGVLDGYDGSMIADVEITS